MRSIFFIDRNNLYYYGGNVHSVLTLPFVPTVVKDIEIIDPEAFEKQLDDFIAKNKIEPVETAIIFSRQSSFEKYIPFDPKQPIDVEKERKKFVDNVPFEEIMSEVHTDEKGTRFVAINQDFVSLIKAILEKHHFPLITMTSVAAFLPQGDITFNATTAQELFKNATAIKQASFFKTAPLLAEADMFEEGLAPKNKNTNLYLLIGSFVLLIVVLVFMLIRRQAATKKKTPIKPTPVASSIEKPTSAVSPSPTEASPAAIIDEVPKNELSIQILNGSGVPGQADQIKAKLTEKGYTKSTTGNASVVDTPKTLIIVKPRVSDPQIEEITQVIQEIGTAPVIVQENADIENDILITTARNTTTISTPTP